MKGRCHYCKMLTEAIPGPMSGKTTGGTDPGYRIGYVMEQTGRSWLICAECVFTKMHDRGEKAAA